MLRELRVRALVAAIVFHADHRADASAEFLERWTTRSEFPSAVGEYLRAWNDHDLDRLRALLPEFIYDRRRTGVGRLDADTYIESLRAMFELSSDVRIEPIYEIRVARHALLSANHWYGTNAEGGDFEAVYAALIHVESERFVGLELFEIENLEAANARFESLGAEPPDDQPNATPRLPDRED
jgi:hypothetical protein